MKCKNNALQGVIMNSFDSVVPGHISGIVLLFLGGKGTPGMFNPVF